MGVGAQRRMAAGTLTSRALTRAYLDRIAAVDDSGPQLNAVIDINPAALKDADARDAERRAGRTRGPLHGIPIPRQGQHRRRRDDQFGRFAGLRRQPARVRCLHHSTAPRRRGRHPGQDESERVGELPLDAIDVRVELARRANERTPTPLTVIPAGRARAPRLRQPPALRGRNRNRNQRQHHLSRLRERRRRSEADRRAREPRHHSIAATRTRQDRSGCGCRRGRPARPDDRRGLTGSRNQGCEGRRTTPHFLIATR